MRPLVLRGALLVGLLFALGGAALVIDLPDVDVVRDWIESTGPAAPIVFVAAYTLVVPSPIPKSVLSTAAGIAFGLPLGAALVVTGATAGAILAFCIARALGRDVVETMARGQLHRVDQIVERHGIRAALAIRFIPVLPFTLLNYACGVTAMRLPHYALGTALGIAPGSTVLVALGSAGAVVSLWVPVTVSVLAGLASLLTGLTWKHFKYRSRHQT